MSEYCRKCGTRVTDDLPGGLCPNCLMQVAQRSQNKATALSGNPNFETPPLSQLAQMFPELEIIELIGQGGMGAVYKARQRELDRLVALKIFLYRPDDPEFTERFKREARALGQLSHPNIVTVHQFGNRDEMHFLVMEFVDGLNLRQITLEQRLDPAHAMQLVPQLCDALQFAHDQGVVHRDIKPENILLDSRGNIKIADFGLAKLTNATADAGLTRTQQVMGTWNYMAPEQKERPMEVDHRADIYSLGVVIYEMLTGELPLGRFPSPSEKAQVDQRIDEIVLRALEKDPVRRFQQASEFKSGFESVGGFDYANYPAPPVKSAGYDAAVGNYGATAAATVGYQGAQQGGAYESSTGSRFHFSVMGGTEKKGAWQVGNPSVAFTLMGGTCLDLTEVTAKQVNIISFVMMGGCEIIVPRGAVVDVDGFILMGATENKIVRATSPPPMHVRVRSFGMMGGCEIRSSRAPAVVDGVPQAPVKQAEVETWRRGLVLLYQAFALLVTLSIPIVFLAQSMNIAGGDDLRLAGILVALSAGLFWSLLNSVRVFLGVAPPEGSPDELATFHQSTLIGTGIRSVALLFIFACPMLFVIYSFEKDQELRFAAIVAGFVGAGLYMCAEYVEEFFYPNRNN